MDTTVPTNAADSASTTSPVSDDERRRVLAVLERHTTAGRLGLNEFDQRVTTTLRARNTADLAAVTQDLHEDMLTGPGAGQPKPRALVAAVGVVMTTFVMLGVLLAVTL